MSQRRKKPTIFIIVAAIIALNIFGSGVIPILIFGGIFFMINSSRQKNRQNRNQDTRNQQRTRSNRSTNRKTAPPRRQTRSAAPTRRSNNNFSKSNPFKKSGIAKYKEFDLDGAVADFEQGLAISEGDVALHWNIAAAYSLTEKKDKAFFHLNRAVELGFNDFEKIQTHDDLAFLRIQPEFDDFKANGYKLGAKQAQQSRESKRLDAPEKEANLTDDILLSQLNKLAELRKKGLLSEQEFVTERKKLLRR